MAIDSTSLIRSATAYPVTAALTHAATLERLKSGNAYLSSEGFWHDGPEGQAWRLTQPAVVMLACAHIVNNGSLYCQYDEKTTSKTYRLVAVELVDGTRLAVPVAV